MGENMTPTECPNCLKPDGFLPILWGLPDFDKDLVDNYFIGGCIVPDTEPWPEWHCAHCDHEWGHVEQL